MLFNIFAPLADDFGPLNVFRYLTFRTGGAVLTALLFSFLFGPMLIRLLRRKQGNGQPIRDDGPKDHIIKKAGTPTMGGFLILISLTLSTLLWADITSGYVWVTLLVALGFGGVGFADDFLKVTRQSSEGLPAHLKFILEIAISVAATMWILQIAHAPLAGNLAVPFFKELLIDMGWFFIPFAVCVMVGTSNAVNLTDGLDGLAIVPIMIAAASFALIAYLVGNAVFANYLQLHQLPGSGELAVLCGALVGASLGFLWYNAPPAMVFMGDTGSLAAGGLIGAVSVITKHELVLLIIGGLFVLETVSVIVQVISFSLTGLRVFRMYHMHNHFEQKGWAEATIVIRFWIIAFVLALLGLATLKLR